MGYKLPKPIGKYTVGIKHTSFEYINGNEKREIPMYIYYPADSDEGKAPYPYGVKEVFVPTNAEEVSATKTHCYADVQISNDKDKFPLVIFSVGFGCFTMLNTVLCSDLASSGFVVASIGHPGDGAVLFPDGRIGQITQKNIDEMMNEERNKKLEAYIPRFDAIGDNIEAVELGREYFSLQPFFNDNLEIWLKDTSAAIDYFESQNINVQSMFYQNIDFTCGVSVGGHSYGGAAAVDIARRDSRVVCGVNIDGGNFGNHYGEDIKKPFLSIGNPHIWGMLMGYTIANTEDSFYVGILDGDHMGFTDCIYFGPSDRVGTRDKDDYRMVVSDYYLSFIKTYQTKKQNSFHKANYKNTKYYEKSKIL